MCYKQWNFTPSILSLIFMCFEALLDWTEELSAPPLPRLYRRPSVKLSIHRPANDFENQPSSCIHLFTYVTNERLLENLESDFLLLHSHVLPQPGVRPTNFITNLTLVDCGFVRNNIHTVGIKRQIYMRS